MTGMSSLIGYTRLHWPHFSAVPSFTRSTLVLQFGQARISSSSGSTGIGVGSWRKCCARGSSVRHYIRWRLRRAGATRHYSQAMRSILLGLLLAAIAAPAAHARQSAPPQDDPAYLF